MKRRPVVTWLVAGASLLLFAAPGLAERARGSVHDLWTGGWWHLLTTTLVHANLLHVGFNLYWLWILGRIMEEEIGSGRMLAFLVSSAFVSSALAISFSGPGVGLSGVIYGVFGFMWVARPRYPAFGRAADRDTVNLFVVWFFVCIAATYMGVMRIGNVAHGTGLLFGAACGAVAARSRWRRAGAAVGGALAVLSVVVLFWSPWSASWNFARGYEAHGQERYEDAERYYRRSLARGGQPQPIWHNLVLVYRALGDEARAAAALQQLRQVDLNAADELENR